MDLKKLRDFFPAKDIEFRLGATTQDKTEGNALAYITNRAIQNRLDEVCGAENWKNEFKEWKGSSQLCGISIRINDEWVTKWDGAPDTDFEGVKGGLSDSMKRAAYQWGIGRYLYDMPNQWEEIVPSSTGKGYKFKNVPKVPTAFLPKNDTTSASADVVSEDEKNLANIVAHDKLIGEKERKKLNECIVKYNLSVPDILTWAKIEKLDDMTVSMFSVFIGTLQKKYKEVKFEFTSPEVSK